MNITNKHDIPTDIEINLVRRNGVDITCLEEFRGCYFTNVVIIIFEVVGTKWAGGWGNVADTVVIMKLLQI